MEVKQMKDIEIFAANKVIEKLIEESLHSSNPTVISNNLIKLSAWKFRFGELVAESAKLLQEAENNKDFVFSTAFIEAKNTVKMLAGKEKIVAEEEAKAVAILNSKDEREGYVASIWYKTRVLNFWRDLETVIDAIKYKQRALESEYKNLQFGQEAM